MIRNSFTALLLLSTCFVPASPLRAQENPAASQEQKQPSKPAIPEPRAKNGKRLLGAENLMKVAAVGAPRISPDGSRVAYTVSEVKMEKDKEWKTVTQVWVVPIAGGKAMQYTRGDKSSTAPDWSPDGGPPSLPEPEHSERARIVNLLGPAPVGFISLSMPLSICDSMNAPPVAT